MSPTSILVVVERLRRYDFGLRIETGTERPLLLYIIYKCTVQYTTQLIEEVVNTYACADIFNIIQKVQDTSIHLEVDEE